MTQKLNVKKKPAPKSVMVNFRLTKQMKKDFADFLKINNFRAQDFFEAVLHQYVYEGKKK